MPPIKNLLQRSRSRLAYSVEALVASVAIGTVGFSLIEGWTVGDGLDMTLMTVTTVGYGPPQPLFSRMAKASSKESSKFKVQSSKDGPSS